jgi:hypothetical protein
MTRHRMIGHFAEDIRVVAPKEWVKHLDDAFTHQLPTRGSVKSPNGLVHAIIGDYTYCDIQWCAYSRKEERNLRVVGWETGDAPITCLECLVES